MLTGKSYMSGHRMGTKTAGRLGIKSCFANLGPRT